MVPATFSVIHHLRDPVRELLHELASKARRVIIIHDDIMRSVVQDVVSIPNAEAQIFHSISAFANFLNTWEGKGMPQEVEARRYIPQDDTSLEGCFPSDFMDLLFESGNLFNAKRVMERDYMDLWDRILEDKKNWAIGPLNLVESLDKKEPKDRHICLEWLDKQALKSVMYVSFVTTTTFNDKEIEELALGLEQSKQKFIWVLRDADKGDIFDDEAIRKIELPKGYEERVRNMGIGVRDSAPQLENLAHPSTGGFLSHCGWNSCVESTTMGVPIGAWPMHCNQPRDATLITEVLKVGTVVRDWKPRHEVAVASMVAEGVKKLMASKEGDLWQKVGFLVWSLILSLLTSLDRTTQLQ